MTFVVMTPLERRCCINGVRLRAHGGATIDGKPVAAWVADVPEVPIYSTEQHSPTEHDQWQNSKQ